MGCSVYMDRYQIDFLPIFFFASLDLLSPSFSSALISLQHFFLQSTDRSASINKQILLVPLGTALRQMGDA